MAQSDAVIANAYQHRSDVLLSSAVLVGLVGSIAGYPILDPIAGLLVSGVILNLVLILTKLFYVKITLPRGRKQPSERFMIYSTHQPLWKRPRDSLRLA